MRESEKVATGWVDYSRAGGVSRMVMGGGRVGGVRSEMEGCGADAAGGGGGRGSRKEGVGNRMGGTKGCGECRCGGSERRDSGGGGGCKLWSSGGLPGRPSSSTHGAAAQVEFH